MARLKAQRSVCGLTVGVVCLGWPGHDAAALSPQSQPSRSVRLDRPWVVQPEIGFAPSPRAPLPGYVYLGLSVQRALARHLDVELMLGKAGSSNVLRAPPGQPVRSVSVSTGVHTRWMLRGVIGLDERDQWALSAALGPLFMFGGDYGGVALVRGEGAIEFRSRGGFAVLYGIGYDLSLVDSRSPFPAVECVETDCSNWFDSGHGQVSARLALGVAF